jgi:hypothetical protein
LLSSRKGEHEYAAPPHDRKRLSHPAAPVAAAILVIGRADGSDHSGASIVVRGPRKTTMCERRMTGLFRDRRSSRE